MATCDSSQTTQNFPRAGVKEGGAGCRAAAPREGPGPHHAELEHQDRGIIALELRSHQLGSAAPTHGGLVWADVEHVCHRLSERGTRYHSMPSVLRTLTGVKATLIKKQLRGHSHN